MISINREKGYIILSRCDYLYRDGNRDDQANREMGDGDIVIHLPPHMVTRDYDNGKNGSKRVHGSDGQSAEIIIAEIQKRLGLKLED